MSIGQRDMDGEGNRLTGVLKMNMIKKHFTVVLAAAIFAGVVFASRSWADEKAEGKEELKIKLPKPAFLGTPKTKPVGIKNLELPTGKPRPAYMVPAGSKNVALNKSVTSSDKEPIIGKLDQITDGDKEATDGSWV